ncbi:MAG: GrpB family protein, partial [Planctomycetota bacterium]
MKITLSEYNYAWPELFEQEKEILGAHLSSCNPTIKHVGSTAVPHLVAKPIIDIMIGLSDFTKADSFVPCIQELGYIYFKQYEDVMPYRRFFKKQNGNIVTHHIHMVETETEFWIRHLLFRDFLRDNQTVAADYADLKLRLAQQEWKDGNEYAGAKT